MRRKLLLGFTLSVALMLSACQRVTERRQYQTGRNIAGGDPLAGRDRILHYGCQACHTIPGVAGANALVGPPLLHWSRRVYIAGHFPNTPDNLIRWLEHPPQLVPGTAMPDMGITEHDARDIATYLYSLQ